MREYMFNLNCPLDLMIRANYIARPSKSWGVEHDVYTMKAADWVLDREKPDLVVLNDDIITGDKAFPHNSRHPSTLSLSRLLLVVSPGHPPTATTTTGLILALRIPLRMSADTSIAVPVRWCLIPLLGPLTIICPCMGLSAPP
jgi:hypothetical protein